MLARLNLAPTLTETARLAPRLEAEAEAASWPESVAFAIGLCLEEIVTNIASTGPPPPPRPRDRSPRKKRSGAGILPASGRDRPLH